MGDITIDGTGKVITGMTPEALVDAARSGLLVSVRFAPHVERLAAGERTCSVCGHAAFDPCTDAEGFVTHGPIVGELGECMPCFVGRADLHYEETYGESPDSWGCQHGVSFQYRCSDCGAVPGHDGILHPLTDDGGVVPVFTVRPDPPALAT